MTNGQRRIISIATLEVARGSVSRTFHGRMFTSPRRRMQISMARYKKHMATVPNINKPVSDPVRALFRPKGWSAQGFPGGYLNPVGRGFLKGKPKLKRG